MLELKEGQRHPITMTLDGQEVRGLTEPRMLLSDFLRQELGRPEVHVGCEHGVCGSCTVCVNGEIVRGCLMLAVQCDGAKVETIEGLSDSGEVADLQAAFEQRNALQCGYCTPGILLSTEAFLSENAKPSEQEVREMLSGHICRCTGYVGMVDAILETAQKRASAATP